ncbi:hypothetical protein Amme_047_015 [Acidomonas methanolica NBRC 104435]|uniref:Uncharacterized protein n=1 Tax=Acidomonas methanolica NBRC 104435 TaxID=1231351 RepID=A0A023D5M6_ACIMT|nr:hypothetical protein Amme_047_015 [Acidomonas methanolica NBRC 104435]
MPVRMVMAPPHSAQWIRPVSMAGPLMTAEGMTVRLFDLPDIGPKEITENWVVRKSLPGITPFARVSA